MAWMSKPDNPFRYFNSSPEVIRLVVMLYVRFPMSLRNVEGPCHINLSSGLIKLLISRVDAKNIVRPPSLSS